MAMVKEELEATIDGENIDACHTPKKKKKKKHDNKSADVTPSKNETSCMTEKSGDSVKKKKQQLNDDVRENGADNTLVDREGSVKLEPTMPDPYVEQETWTKKKKKRKREIDEGIPQKKNEIKSNKECEENLTPTSKRKKKKIYEGDQQMCEETSAEERLSSTFDCEDVETPLPKEKKKKKKKKQELSEDETENNISIGTSICVTEGKSIQEDTLPTSSTKKKKKRKESLPQYEDSKELEESKETCDGESSGKKPKSKVTFSDSFSNEAMEEDLKDSGLSEMDVEGSDGGEGFTIIDKVKAVKRKKVDRVLPDWLSNPTRVSMDLSKRIPIENVTGLDPFLLEKLKNEKIDTFFPIQAATIPKLIASSRPISMRYRPRDVCVSAQTGSGKTLVYVLPIIQALRSRVVPHLRTVVLLPTMNLAKQVYEVFETYTKDTNLNVKLDAGSGEFKKVQTQLGSVVDILIATPGRLLDVLNIGTVDTHYLRFLVIDEVDLFLTSSGGSLMLKLEQIKMKLHRPPPDNDIICGGFKTRDCIQLPKLYLQQILVSATLMHHPEQLKVLGLYRPELFIAAKNVAITERSVDAYMRPTEIREEYVEVDPSLKPLVLHYLLENSQLQRVLVFTKSVQATKSLQIVLSAMTTRYKVAKFSSMEKQRNKIVENFASGKIRILIASDALARGLDITEVDQVVSYDVPSLPTYVHRIGRTGRAGKEGFALTLVEDTPEGKRDFGAIQAVSKDRLHQIEVSDKEVEPYMDSFLEALVKLKEQMKVLVKDRKRKRDNARVTHGKKAKLKKKKKT